MAGAYLLQRSARVRVDDLSAAAMPACDRVLEPAPVLLRWVGFVSFGSFKMIGSTPPARDRRRPFQVSELGPLRAARNQSCHNHLEPLLVVSGRLWSSITIISTTLALRRGTVGSARNRKPRIGPGENRCRRRCPLVDTRVIYCGDNLEQLAKLPDACVDLIYIDPPFNSNRNYEVFWGETKEKRAFEDRHESTQAYIDYMRPRCVELARVLKKTGSFYYHCDWHASHYVKVMLDQIFGENNFQCEIIWQRDLRRRVWPSQVSEQSRYDFLLRRWRQNHFQPALQSLRPGQS